MSEHLKEVCGNTRYYIFDRVLFMIVTSLLHL